MIDQQTNKQIFNKQEMDIETQTNRSTSKQTE